MGYYSNVMVAVTKNDFKKIDEKLKIIPDNYLLVEFEADDYTENNVECVLMDLGYIKYYEEYEEVQAFEKSLQKAKDGYVFCRLGEEAGDIEFRNRAKVPELLAKFDFIKELRNNLNKELGEEEEEFE